MEDDDDGMSAEIVCPACGAAQDAYAAAVEQGAPRDDGATKCLYCGVASPDDDWVEA